MPHRKLNFLGKKVDKRDSLIFSFIAGKIVAHYGCVDDDEDVIERKSAEGIHLHTRITELSRSTIGIDMNKRVIPILAEKYGIDNIYYGDIQDPETFTVEREKLAGAEVVLIADVIEHLNNPGNMLSGLLSTFNEDITIIITTPNPFMIMNFFDTLRNREGYSDWHTCYFSLSNMKNLLERYGIEIAAVHPYNRESNSLSSFKRELSALLKKFFTLFSKGFCDGFLYECKIRKP